MLLVAILARVSTHVVDARMVIKNAKHVHVIVSTNILDKLYFARQSFLREKNS